MAVTFKERLMHGWNAFMNKDPTLQNDWDKGASNSRRPDIIPFSRKVEQTIVNGVYTKIAIDVSQLTFLHVKTNKDGKYESTIDSKLNYAMTVEANIDQTAQSFKTDAVFTMLDEGTVALVPVDTTVDATRSNAFDIQTLRVGTVSEWYPKHVKVNVYNENTGHREEVILPKSMVALVENPFLHIMNTPNSYYQKLLQKIKMLDVLNVTMH